MVRLKEVRVGIGWIQEGTFWGDHKGNVLYLDRGLRYTNNSALIYLRSVHFIICKFYLKR